MNWSNHAPRFKALVANAALKGESHLRTTPATQPFGGARMLRDMLKRAVLAFGRNASVRRRRRCALRRYYLLQEDGIRIRIDGKKCWRDDVFVERRWKRVKYEEGYLKTQEPANGNLPKRTWPASRSSPNFRMG